MEDTQLWLDYSNGLQYQSLSGLAKTIPACVNFYEGRQWAEATPLTRNMPRVQLNITQMICRSKKSAILSTPVRIVYRGGRVDADTERFNRFASYITKELGQEELDKKAVHDGVVKGTYVYHYFWDAEAKGKTGIKEGGVRCEVIDPLRIFFSDPTQEDEQKQKWIIVASRESIDAVKAKCDPDCDKDSIGPDENDVAYGTKEQTGSELCTVLTRYFRQDGEVYVEKATKSVIVNKPHPLAPDVKEALKVINSETKLDAPNDDTPDTNEKTLTDTQVRASLYPIVVGCYEPKEGSIYGIGEVEGLIPNQKVINFMASMHALNLQENAWGKYIILPGALGEQTITNEPGQILEDKTGTGQGIRKMTETGLNAQSIQLVDSLMTMTRSVSGATEVLSGEVLGANMSGTAIAALQSQAQQPIEELKDAFWLAKIKQGKVLAQFYKLFYEAKEFMYPIDDMPLGKGEMGEDIFFGSHYQNMEYEVVCEATSGAKATIASDIQALDNLLAQKAINVETYIKSYPEDMLTNKNELLKGIEAERSNQLAEAQTQVQQLASQLEQMEKIVMQQKETIDKAVSAIQDNNNLKATLVTLYNEATGKINEANRKIQETTDDATYFAQQLQARDSKQQGTKTQATVPASEQYGY